MGAAAYAYSKIDAFTDGHSMGNPAACLYLRPEQTLSDAQMLTIAKQHKGFVSEVIFCSQVADGYRLAYYSSECEVAFCGHGTIACMVGLIKRTPALLAQQEIRVTTHLKGALTVYNRIAEQNAVLITAPAPKEIGANVSRGEIASALGIAEQAMENALPVDCIDAGLRTLIVPLRDLQTELVVSPDEQALKRFCTQHGADILLIFSLQAENPRSIAHTRVFAPKFGYLEDPATGSGNSALGYYMLKNKLWNGGDCRLEQGSGGQAFNCVHLSKKDGAVLFGGGAAMRIDGVIYV